VSLAPAIRSYALESTGPRQNAPHSSGNLFTLTADVSSQSVELLAAHLVIPEPDLFNPPRLWCGFDEPIAEDLLFNHSESMYACDRVLLG
jgi:hypothetical protein